MTNENEYGECELCGEHGMLHNGTAIVDGRVYEHCAMCDDCTIPPDELCDECPPEPIDVSSLPEQITVKCNESHLTVARYCNRTTVCIAHDGNVNIGNGYDGGVLDNIIDTIVKIRLDDVVTCITIVITPHIRYCVTPVTLSGTVWHITVQSGVQTKMALNTIGVKLAHRVLD